MDDISQFKARLQENRPELRTAGEQQAAVAMIIRLNKAVPEVLLIERAYNANDPWSGHLALPGGHMEKQDKKLQDTAIRETFEETGLILQSCHYLGRLSDVDAGIKPLVIACFVYSCPGKCQLTLDAVEVSDAFWVPLSHLEIRRETRIKRRLMSGIKEVPAISLPGRHQPLWGITLRFVREARQLLLIK